MSPEQKKHNRWTWLYRSVALFILLQIWNLVYGTYQKIDSNDQLNKTQQVQIDGHEKRLDGIDNLVVKNRDESFILFVRKK